MEFTGVWVGYDDWVGGPEYDSGTDPFNDSRCQLFDE